MKVNEILSASLLGYTLLLWSCDQPQTKPADVERKVITIESESVELSNSYSASIRGRQDIKILPRVDGYLTKVLVTEGQSVKRGEVMFIIDQVPYQAALKSASANVSVAKASVATAELTYDSRKELHRKNIVSDFDLTASHNALLTAKAQLEVALAQELSARNNLSYTRITSPSDGVVGKLPYRMGDYVAPSISDGLTVVADNSQMYVYFSMTESQVLELVDTYGSPQVAIEQMPQVELLLSNQTIYKEKGRVESISGVIDQMTGSVSLRAVYPNPDGYLISGGAGSVVMPYLRENVFIIPQEATFEVQDKTFVYRVIDGVAKATIIRVDKINDGKEYVVLSGLQKGDIIVAEGAGLLSEGTPIKVAKQ